MNEEVKWERVHYDNGQLNWEIPYVNGQVHGISKRWHESGQLQQETTYVNGQAHGIQRHWYSNGQLKWEIPYVNGQRHGITRFWNEDGKLWSIEKWHRGQKFIDLRFDPIPSDAMMELDLITNIFSYE